MPGPRLAGGWDLLFGFLAFAVMTAAALLLLRALSKRGIGAGGKYLKVLERLPLSRDVSVVIMEIGGRTFAVCIGKEGGNLLCEINAEQEPEKIRARRTGSPKPAGNGFLGRFWHNLKLNMGLLPKGTKPQGPADAEDAPGFEALLEAIEKARAEENNRPGGSISRQDAPAFAALLEQEMQSGQKSPLRAQSPSQTSAVAKPQPPAAPKPAVADKPLIDRDYRAALENMRRVSKLPPEPSPEPLPSRAAEADSRPEARKTPDFPVSDQNSSFDAERYDEILDRIAQRQNRYLSKGPQKR